MTLHDLSEKDVIQIQSGENLGRIDDLVFDAATGKLLSVILRGRGHFFGLLGYDEDLVIPWESLKKIGTDVIMTDVEPTPRPPRGGRRQ